MNPPQWQTPIKNKHIQQIGKKFSKTHKRQIDQSLENYALTNKKYDQTQEQHPEMKIYNPILYKHYKNNAKKILQQSMEDSQYSEASRQIKRINRIKTKQDKQRIRAVSAGHKHEKMLVKQAHQEQMNGFRRAWNEVFCRFKMYQREKREQIKRANQIDQQNCRYEIIRRCRSAKPSTKIAQIIQLQHQQKGLRKRGKTNQLRQIRSEKKRIKKQCQIQLQKTYSRIITQQQKNYKERETKRYSSFMQRIKQNKRDQQKIYKRQQQRLKQKFKNIIKKLQHEQLMEINQLRGKSIVA